MEAITKVEEVLKGFKRRQIIYELVEWMGSYEEIFGIEGKMKIVDSVEYDFWLSCK